VPAPTIDDKFADDRKVAQPLNDEAVDFD